MSTQLSENERTQVATIRHLQLELINKYAPKLNREGMQRLQAIITPQMPKYELQRLIETELANKQTQATERAMVRHMQLEIINKKSQGLSPVSIKKLQETINPNMSKPELMSLIEHQRTFDNTSGIEGRISLVESKIIHEKQVEILAREAAGLPPSSQARLRAQLSPNLPRERLTAAIAEEKRTVADLKRELGTIRPVKESVSPQQTRSAMQSFIEGRVGLKEIRVNTKAALRTYLREGAADTIVGNQGSEKSQFKIEGTTSGQIQAAYSHFNQVDIDKYLGFYVGTKDIQSQDTPQYKQEFSTNKSLCGDPPEPNPSGDGTTSMSVCSWSPSLSKKDLQLGKFGCSMDLQDNENDKWTVVDSRCE